MLNRGEYDRYPALSSKSKSSLSYSSHLIPLHDPTDLLDRSRRILCNALFGKNYPTGLSKRGYEYVLQYSTFHMELGSNWSILPSRMLLTPSSHRTPLHLLLPRLVHTPTPHLPLPPICTVSLLLLIRMRLLIKTFELHIHTALWDSSDTILRLQW